MSENNYGSTTLLAILLFILFLGLKLGHVINWSWWLVLTPLLVIEIVALTPYLIIGIICGALIIVELCKTIKRKIFDK